VQLFSISTLCMIGWVRYGIVSINQMFHNTKSLTYLLSTFFIYSPYAQTIFLPYACLFFMPEIKKKLILIWRSSYCRKRLLHQNEVHVMTIAKKQHFNSCQFRHSLTNIFQEILLQQCTFPVKKDTNTSLIYHIFSLMVKTIVSYSMCLVLYRIPHPVKHYYDICTL
jgi:hypothetical protein